MLKKNLILFFLIFSVLQADDSSPNKTPYTISSFIENLSFFPIEEKITVPVYNLENPNPELFKSLFTGLARELAEIMSAGDTLTYQDLTDSLGLDNDQFEKDLIEFLPPLARGTQAVSAELWATLRYVIPYRLIWAYRANVEKSIPSWPVTSERTPSKGTLFFLGGTSDGSPILLLHGDRSHPSILLGIYESIRKNHPDRPIYVLGMSLGDEDEYDSEDLPFHHDLVLESIHRIQEVSQQPLILIGHSKGAQLGAITTFLNKKKVSLISVAGRLAIPENDETCHPSLRPTIMKIERAIRENPAIPLYQVVAEKDWLAPRESFALRPFENCTIIPNARHLNIIFSNDTFEAIQHYINLIDES